MMPDSLIPQMPYLGEVIAVRGSPVADPDLGFVGSTVPGEEAFFVYDVRVFGENGAIELRGVLPSCNRDRFHFVQCADVGSKFLAYQAFGRWHLIIYEYPASEPCEETP